MIRLHGWLSLAAYEQPTTASRQGNQQDGCPSKTPAS
jgi:hypothetical protein